MTLAFVLLVVVLLPIRSLIWRAMVRKACSTLLAFLADVSRKGMPRLSANSWGSGQYLLQEQTDGMVFVWNTFATVYSTTFLSAISLLFPTSSLLTPSVAYRSISCSHCLTLLKLSMSVTS